MADDLSNTTHRIQFPTKFKSNFNTWSFQIFCLNTDGESTAVGPQAMSPDKEEDQPQEKINKEKEPAQEEAPRKTSSKAKRRSPVKELSDSESELRLPPIRPETVTSSGTKSPCASSVRAATPEGQL